MDMIFLPSKVKDFIEKSAAGQKTLACVRASGSLTGKSGEGYMALLADRVMLFSREFGMDAYENTEINIANGISGISVRREKYNSFIDFNTGSKNYSLKFSGSDEKELKPLLDLLEKKTADAPASSPVQPAPPHVESQKERKISPIAGMAAAMMYVAGSDQKFAEEEEKYIRDTIINDESILEKAYEYYGSHSYEELINDLSFLDHHQALCITAHLIEVGMSDGLLESGQQRMIWQFAAAMKISEAEYRNFLDVLLAKNQTSALY
ncbi:MAG: hypothetical protein A2020_05660 [Lentisphaerae bacterium GWF2_45_14]|nr:MAG: hypothetical protein A2020_05660 [Lentisphaerae bacterium GWF2_45_14]